MQSENFDKIVRDSLSQRPPEKDIPRWDKMEPLLDKHMPIEKKDRRRIFFILFAFLLVGGGAFFVWSNNKVDKNDISVIESKTGAPGDKRATEQTPTSKTPDDNNIRTEGSSGQDQTGTANEVNSKQPASEPENQVSLPSKPAGGIQTTSINPIPARTKNRISGNLRQEQTTDITVNEDIKGKKETVLKPAEDRAVNATEPANTRKEEEAKDGGLPKTKQQEETASSRPVIAPRNDSQQIRKPQPKSQPAASKQQKVKSGFLNNLFFTATVGGDLSTVGVGSAGKVKPVIGAGIGYRISDRFSIRTGFYSARKVYDADPEDYHPPYNFWAYYPNLKTIEADCKVYEIPVTIDYTFRNKGGKQNWFVAAGVSSLLMKKETYEYYYKPTTSPTYITYTRTINDQNKHYFSVLNLSGGYRRNISNSFSLQAEPYARIAMSGVGYGKVKLNSGGVVFSAIVKPFGRK